VGDVFFFGSLPSLAGLEWFRCLIFPPLKMVGYCRVSLTGRKSVSLMGVVELLSVVELRRVAACRGCRHAGWLKAADGSRPGPPELAI